jgi:hypothetical protein
MIAETAALTTYAKPNKAPDCVKTPNFGIFHVVSY